MQRFDGITLADYLSNSSLQGDVFLGSTPKVTPNDYASLISSKEEPTAIATDLTQLNPTTEAGADTEKTIFEQYLDTINKEENTVSSFTPSEVQGTPKPTSGLGSYYDNLGSVESNNTYDAHRKGSAFYGKYQFSFTEAKRHLDQLGKTWADFKKDPKIQEQVVRLNTIDHTKRLKKIGVEPTQFNLWATHNLGFAGGVGLIKGRVSKGTLSNIRNQAGMDSNSTPKDYINYYKEKFN